MTSRQTRARRIRPVNYTISQTSFGAFMTYQSFSEATLNKSINDRNPAGVLYIGTHFRNAMLGAIHQGLRKQFHKACIHSLTTKPLACSNKFWLTMCSSYFSQFDQFLIITLACLFSTFSCCQSNAQSQVRKSIGFLQNL